MEFDVTTIMVIGTATYALLSEVIGLKEKWKANSVIQVVMSVLGKLFK